MASTEISPTDGLITDVDDLEERLSRPTELVLRTLQTLDSDLVVLGVGGKMGPTLARMAARALATLQLPYRVYGVARFSQPALRQSLEQWGVKTIACDLLNRADLAALPASHNVIFMAGQKFGTTGAASTTWALNSYLPALVAERYSKARLVAFSTGNVYAYSPVVHGGASETDELAPVGEYAASCVGRERIFEHFARTQGLRCAIMRLNYAIEMRYGVLVDIAQRVLNGAPVSLTAGAFNAIWQGDANAQALALLAHCASPPFVLNVTGPETISVQWVAQRFGELLGREPIYDGAESSNALLSNAARAQQLFGYPTVSLNQLIEWVAHWVQIGAPTLNKPTHFESRDGRF
jgi:nucleoside-diphosphate-sugar epimerase